jgi:arylsulfatase A-like enzyme
LPTREFVGSTKVDLYGDFTHMIDAEIGKVLGALDKTGMAKDTIVVFTADNGPVWYDVDTKKFSHDSSGGLRGMKADAWEAGHRMPFIMRWPAAIKRGQTADRTICFTDLFRTFADLTGAEIPKGQGTRQRLIPSHSQRRKDQPSQAHRDGSRTKSLSRSFRRLETHHRTRLRRIFKNRQKGSQDSSQGPTLQSQGRPRRNQ